MNSTTQNASESTATTTQAPTLNLDLIIPDPAVFRSEWEAGAAGLDERTRRVLDEVCYLGRHASDVGAELGLTRERIRQLATRGAATVFAHALIRPRGALIHAVEELADWSERAALNPWQYRRMDAQGRGELALQLHRLGALLEPDPAVLAAPCNLLRPETRNRPRFLHSERRLLAAVESAGQGNDGQMDDDAMLDALVDRVPELAAWPEVELRPLLTAHAPAAIAADGSVRWQRPSRPSRSRVNPTAEYAKRALAEFGKPMHRTPLLTEVQRLASDEGAEVPTAPMLALALKRRGEFRWTGKATYGLAEWGVGHASDWRRSRGQWSTIRQELVTLFADRRDRPIKEVIAHFRRGFTVSERSIYERIRMEPDLHLRDGIVRVGVDPGPETPPTPADGKGRAAPSPRSRRAMRDRQVLRPDALREARERRQWSVIHLAVLAGLDPRRVGDFEAGRVLPRTAELLDLVAELETPAEALLQHPPAPDRYTMLVRGARERGWR